MDKDKVPELLPGVRIAVRMLQFQKQDIFSAIWATPGMSGEQLLARVTSAILADQDHFHMFDACPQPGAEEVARSMALMALVKLGTAEDLRDALSLSNHTAY